MTAEQQNEFLRDWANEIRRMDPMGWQVANDGWDSFICESTSNTYYGGLDGRTSQWELPPAPVLPGWELQRPEGRWSNMSRELWDTRRPAASQLHPVGRYLVWRLHDRTEGTHELGINGHMMRRVHANDFVLCVIVADGSHTQEEPRRINEMCQMQWPCILVDSHTPSWQMAEGVGAHNDRVPGFCPGLAWNYPPSRPWLVHTSRVWTLRHHGERYVMVEPPTVDADTPGATSSYTPAIMDNPGPAIVEHDEPEAEPEGWMVLPEYYCSSDEDGYSPEYYYSSDDD